MDQIDQWMNRAFDNSGSGETPKKQENPVSQNQGQKTHGTQNFQQQKPENQKNFHQNQKKKGQSRPGQFNNHPGQNQPKANQPVQGQNQPKSNQQGQNQPRHNHPGQKPQNTGGQRFNRNSGQIPNKPHNKKPPKKLTVANKVSKPTPILKGKLKIIPLGGLNEVGKNMTVLEYENDIIIIDMGLEFPSEDLLGIDYVIPDVTYLEDNKKRIKGVFLTHGHLDHIGGIPYIMPKLDFPPLFGTRLTLGLVEKRAEEFKQEKLIKFRQVKPSDIIKLGVFTISFTRVTHSIPDAVAITVDCPAGKFVFSGDFKFDQHPARPEDEAEIPKLEALGRQNVTALFCESTNALKPGHSMSEKDVGETLEKLVRETPGRLIIASFASQIGRMQQIIDAAVKNGRKIFVSGRSMLTNLDIASRLGYLSIQKDLVKDIKRYKNISDRETLILTTGSQGESVSALARIADQEHSQVKIKAGDTIILSSSPIVGNEKAISTIINKLTILGADVIHNQLMDVHTSGHGKQEELKRMVNLVKPKFLIPIHGEFYMRKELAKISTKECNIPDSNIIMIQNGDVLYAENGRIYKSNETVDTKYILIDGSGEGQVGSQVQVDREIMSQNGVVIVLVHINKKSQKLGKDPDVLTRGFIYMHESQEITQEIIKIAQSAYRHIKDKNPGASRKDIKRYIQQSIDKFTHSTLERRPLIVPLIIES